jgi:formate dehydrogenase maturation protein FdhE
MPDQRPIPQPQTNQTGIPGPRCPHCQNAAHVSPVDMGRLNEGVQYWRCATCRNVWATLHGTKID